MTTQLPIMPFIALALLVLPIQLNNKALKTLAFMLWIIGGLVLCVRGGMFLMESPEHNNVPLMAGLVATAFTIGFGKGKFVLSKTSAKNIERLDQFQEPKRPIQVYSIRSWIMISMMVGISIALNVFHVATIVRGPINLGIGFALIISSLAYVKSLAAGEPVEASS